MSVKKRAALCMAGWAAGAAALGLGRAARAQTVEMPFGNGTRPLVAYPEKRALIRMTSRPPQLETPFAVFDEGLLTPNDAFYVRYHLAGLPTDGIDPDTYRVSVKGLVATPLSLGLAEIKAMPAAEIVAVSQCSGNGRGFFEPRVAGARRATA